MSETVNNQTQKAEPKLYFQGISYLRTDLATARVEMARSLAFDEAQVIVALFLQEHRSDKRLREDGKKVLDRLARMANRTTLTVGKRFRFYFSDLSRLDDWGSLSILDLGLSARPHNCLRNAGIETLSALVNEHTEISLLKIPGLGKKGTWEIKESLRRRGLELNGWWYRR